MDELKFQTHLVDGVKRLKGYGLKLTNRFKVGIPDLYLQVPNHPTWVIEAKFKQVPTLKTTPHTKALTPIQRKTIRDMYDAGTCAGYIYGLQVSPRAVHAVGGLGDPGEGTLSYEAFFGHPGYMGPIPYGDHKDSFEKFWSRFALIYYREQGPATLGRHRR